MSMNQHQSMKVSYGEYLTWNDEHRYEIIDGIPYLQAAPTRQHQRIVTHLSGEFYAFLKGKTCEVYIAPFDVRLSATEDNEEYQVVQPDISIVCDERKLDDKGCKGAPDLIVEVLSPSTWQKDRIEKLNLYQKYAVKEYLLIYPNEKIIEQYILGENDVYGTPHIYNETDIYRSNALPEFKITVSTIIS